MGIQSVDCIIARLQDRINELMVKDYDRIKYEINMLNQRIIYLKRNYQTSNVDCSGNELLDGQEECYVLTESTSKLIDFLKELNSISKELGVLYLKYNVAKDLDKKEEENAK